jgi:hypothetical protein
MPFAIRIFIGLALIAAIAAASRGYAGEPVAPASKDAHSKSRTFGAGQIRINAELADLFYVIDNDAFVCTPIEEPRRQGAVLAAIGSADQTWSVNATPLANGIRTVRYPVLADVRTSNGERRVLIPATLVVKKHIKAGEVLHSKDPTAFDIETTRSMKAGESLSVLFINGKNNTPSILSVETANGSPSFTAFLSSESAHARRAAIEVTLTQDLVPL